MPELWRKHKVLLAGAGISLGVLLTFLCLQQLGAAMMDLPPRWLLVSVVPLVIAAVAGGYVKTLKGFGVELEARLAEPVGSLVPEEVGLDLPGGPREDRAYLDTLSTAAKRKITRLSIDQSKAPTCVPGVIETYLKDLKKVEYVEVRNGEGAFQCLIPAKALRKNRKPDATRIEQLAHALIENDVVNEFKDVAITRTVREDDDLVTALRALREAEEGLAAVVSETGRFRGIVETAGVERRLADDVLAARNE